MQSFEEKWRLQQFEEAEGERIEAKLRNKTDEELRSRLAELQRGGLMKRTGDITVEEGKLLAEIALIANILLSREAEKRLEERSRKKDKRSV